MGQAREEREGDIQPYSHQPKGHPNGAQGLSYPEETKANQDSHLIQRYKYSEYHKDYGHSTSKCRELKKALNKLADQG